MFLAISKTIQPQRHHSPSSTRISFICITFAIQKCYILIVILHPLRFHLPSFNMTKLRVSFFIAKWCPLDQCLLISDTWAQIIKRKQTWIYYYIYIIYFYYFISILYYYFYLKWSKNIKKIIISSNMQPYEVIDYSIRHFIIFAMYNKEHN